MSSGLFYLHVHLNIRSVGFVLFLLCCIEIHVFIANSVDPDQTPRFAASDFGLHCQCPFFGRYA